MSTIAVFALCNSSSLAISCESTRFDSKIIVDHVIDGDTLITHEDERIRLIGINTPELRHDGRKHQPGAIDARDRLRQLAQGKTIGLQFDTERRDRLGRTLAHIFLLNGSNVQASLLGDGLAMPLTIPPNLNWISCYRIQSEMARNNEKGLWSLTDYQPIATREITSQHRGFRFIEGKVVNISESKNNIWINLEHNVALRLGKRDRIYFTDFDITRLSSQIIEARGWLYRRNKQFRMRLRHPNNIVIIDSE